MSSDLELLAIDLAAYSWFGLKYLTVTVAIIIFLSGIDDLFIDITYLIIQLRRKLFNYSRHALPKSVDELCSKPEKRIAIIVPAWDESAVIGQMIDNALNTLEYRNFHIIAGNYPNDPDTAREIDAHSKLYPNVHRAEVGHDGPTCKADCLNWIIQHVFEVERQTGKKFDVIVMQDAEDVVHPLSLKVVNWAIDDGDMLQMPVFSLPRKRSAWVASHYMDEFAEWHTKDLVVREAITNIVPSAGVATAFSRHAVERLCDNLDNMPFNTDSLTEDYDVGQRLHAFGLRSAFIRVALPVIDPATGREVGEDIVATREFFPDELGAAIKQKSRWTLGISLMGWEQIGWQGSLANRYYLFRDRKALVTIPATVLAYLIVLQIVIYTVQTIVFPNGVHLPTLVEPNSWVWYLIAFNLPLLANRVIQRAYFVGILYGPVNGLLSIPRILVSNYVGFFAWWRACRRYLRHKVLNEPLTWDKTSHAFPSAEEIRGETRPVAGIPVAPEAAAKPATGKATPARDLEKA